MFERFTEKARRVIFFGRYETSQFGARFIETEHLLLGILREDKAMILRAHLDPESVRKEVESRSTIGERVSTSVDLPLSEQCKRALAYAAEEAEALGHSFIDTGHLLLGLIREETSMAAIVLRQQGVNHETLRDIVRASAEPSPPAAVTSKRPQARAVERSNTWDEQTVQAAASALNAPLARLELLVEGSVKHLDAYSDAYGEQRLKRRLWSRKEGLGHLIDCATTHHQWLARALTEPQLTAAGPPMEDWVSAQQYQTFSWAELVDLWVSMNRLLIHVIAIIPEEKVGTLMPHRRQRTASVVDTHRPLHRLLGRSRRSDPGPAVSLRSLGQGPAGGCMDSIALRSRPTLLGGKRDSLPACGRETGLRIARAGRRLLGRLRGGLPVNTRLGLRYRSPRRFDQAPYLLRTPRKLIQNASE
jgi:hypothetical protein